jgi:hypothetical protein
LGQLLEISAQRGGFCRQIPETHDESLKQYSPVLFNNAIGRQAILESPVIPIDPSKQGPQVFAVAIHICRFNSPHGVGTEQSTPFKELNTELTTCVMAYIFCWANAVFNAEFMELNKLDVIFMGFTTIEVEVFAWPLYTSNAKATHRTEYPKLLNP